MIAHYLNPILVSGCILSLLFWFRYRIENRLWKSWWIYITVFVVIYFAIISAVLCKELILKMELQEFDLNKDGAFRGEEITSEQKDALLRIANDAARKFSIFTGLIFSGALTFVLFLFDLSKKYVWDKYIKKTKALDI